MSTVNRIIIVGNLGRDPEMRSFPNGDRVASFNVATTERWKDKASGELKEHTEWHRVSMMGRLAEIAEAYLRKGSLVYVEGSVRTRKYQDRTGEQKQMVEVRGTELRMLGGKQDDQPEQDAPPAAAPNAHGPKPMAPVKTGALGGGSGFDDIEDDIPFISESMQYDMEPSKARRMRGYDY